MHIIGKIISKDLCSKSIFVNAKILISSYNISIFVLTKIVLEQGY